MASSMCLPRASMPAVRYEERVEKDMIAIPIGPRVQRYITAAAPDYLARHGEPRHPRDLLDHATIRHRFQNGVSLPWEFGEGEMAMNIAPPPAVLANSVDLELGAAVDGLGVIRTFEEFLMPPDRGRETGSHTRSMGDQLSGPFLLLCRSPAPAGARARLRGLPEVGAAACGAMMHARLYELSAQPIGTILNFDMFTYCFGSGKPLHLFW